MCVYGLGTVVDIVLLHAKHHFWIRHLHANYKVRGYIGKAFKDKIWGAAQATNIYAFDHHMHNIYKMEKCAHTYLNGVAKQLWSRHAFNCQTKSDMLLNNLS
jgi:hypothetical protein